MKAKIKIIQNLSVAIMFFCLVLRIKNYALKNKKKIMKELGQNDNQSLIIRRQKNEIVIPRKSNQPILSNV